MKYIVHSTGGFGHSFICQLIFNILTNGKYPIELQPNIGSAHPVFYDRLVNDEVSVVTGIYPVVKSNEPDVVQFAITITEDDIPLAELNHFYKNVMYSNFRGTDNMYWNIYDDLVNSNMLPKRDIQLFNELPEDESKFLIKNIIGKRTLTELMPGPMDSNLIELKFKDIFNDINAIISTIENAVGVKATQSAYDWYEEYLEAQVNLKARHFPWLPK
jgi:hypothetical protein